MDLNILKKKLNNKIISNSDLLSEEDRNKIREKTLYKLNDNGMQNLLICIEELSELQKEIIKYLRGNDNKLQLEEEIADVEIMLEYAKDILKLNKDEIEYIKDIKYERQIQRISL